VCWRCWWWCCRLLGVRLPLIADTRSAVLALAVIMLVKVGLMGVEHFIA